MGPLYQHQGSIGPIIVECEYFDASTGNGPNPTYFSGIRVHGYAPGDNNFYGKYVKCMVVQKA